MELADLRSKIDMETLYVDFALVRNALTIVQVAEDLNVDLSEANKEGERRGTCPKCEKAKSFSINVNTNRFNCFAKGCTLKGGGVIDFFARLYSVSAKEASHLLAFVYGIQPYSLEAKTDGDSSSGSSSSDGKLSVTNQEAAKIEAAAAASREAAPESALDSSALDSSEDIDLEEDIRQTAAYLIASIKHNLAELEQLLLTSRR